MIKKIAAVALAAGLGAVVLAAPAQAEPGGGNGNANGQVGCTIANGMHFDTPAEMLKYLTWRDGSFQNTVAAYSQFSSVGDLIAQKCGDPEGFPVD